MLKDSFNNMRKQGSKFKLITQSPDNLQCFPLPDEQQRIERAIELASRFGGSDEVHHLRWVIDQMVRELAGERYDQVVASACAGEDGADTWRWDTGIAP